MLEGWFWLGWASAELRLWRWPAPQGVTAPSSSYSWLSGVFCVQGAQGHFVAANRKEMVRITAEGMSVKNASMTSAERALHTTSRKWRSQRDPTKFMQNLDQSFWIAGGDSLQFTYLRGRFVLGKQLDNKLLRNSPS